jgi:hypothetical protein
MQQISGGPATLNVVALLGLLPLVLVAAHGLDEDPPTIRMGMAIERPTIPITNSTTAGPESYFQSDEHAILMFGHILTMTISWVFVLPIGR